MLINLSIDEAFEELIRRCKPYVAADDVGGLRAVFVEIWTDVQVQNPGNEANARRAIRQALEVVLGNSKEPASANVYDNLDDFGFLYE